MRPSDSSPGLPQSRTQLLLFLGPVLVLLAWFMAGQWSSAGTEPRAWLQLVGILFVASAVPLPGKPVSLGYLRALVHRWGWVAVVGLLVTM